MLPFYTPWKYQKPKVFREYEIGTLARDGLINKSYLYTCAHTHGTIDKKSSEQINALNSQLLFCK